MSDPSPGAIWQQPQLVEEFMNERQTVLPLIGVQEDLMRELFRRHAHPVSRFLDIGAGDGAMSELLLGVEPEAHAVLVDFSEPMLSGVARRLGPAGGRWSPVRGDLSDPAWRDRLPPGSYSAAISSYAIHHLPAERKAGLFAELFELLEPGAMFVNMDVVTITAPLAGLFDEQMAENAIHAEHARRGPRPDEEVAAELLKDDEEDRPDSAERQLGWLRDAGFADVELHFKWAEGAIFGGIKPNGGSD
jgi:ubiquinone/menaquinone biosynthesis C-methylase UbiE